MRHPHVCTRCGTLRLTEKMPGKDYSPRVCAPCSLELEHKKMEWVFGRQSATMKRMMSIRHAHQLYLRRKMAKEQA